MLRLLRGGVTPRRLAWSLFLGLLQKRNRFINLINDDYCVHESSIAHFK
jgi:hypothetical protein